LLDVSLVFMFAVAALVVLLVARMRMRKGGLNMPKKHHPHHEDCCCEVLDQIASDVGAILELLQSIPAPASVPRPTIQLVLVDVDVHKEKLAVTDHSQPIQLPSVSVRALLRIVDPRKADGSRVTDYAWSTSDATQLPLEAAANDTAKDVDGNEILDPTDNLPLTVFQTYALTPLSQDDIDALPATPDGSPKSAGGTVTAKSAGMADVDIRVSYNDPPLGHAVITGGVAPEA
jgi:hypothetical protein